MSRIEAHSPRTILASFILVLLLSSCDAKKAVIGKWNLASSELCSQIYANQVEFFENGKYTGGVLYWNGGEYSVLDRNRIQMQTRVGLHVYDYRVTNNELVFVDSSHCEFKYKRAEDDPAK